jgi:mannose/fructose/N-acetylgalactosamine-specific phosphotransferase system component IID
MVKAKKIREIVYEEIRDYDNEKNDNMRMSLFAMLTGVGLIFVLLGIVMLAFVAAAISSGGVSANSVFVFTAQGLFLLIFGGAFAVLSYKSGSDLEKKMELDTRADPPTN